MTDFEANNDRLRVVVDAARCQGYGLCVGIDPDVFDIPDGSLVAYVLRDVIDGDQRRDVEEAVVACPAQAISLHKLEH